MVLSLVFAMPRMLNNCVFAGGGSLLLRGMIERGNKVAFPIFIEDIHANAIGYEVLYQSEVAASQ